MRRMKFLFRFHQSIPFFKEFFLSKEVNRLAKIISTLFIAVYLVFPFDIIPDYLLVLGLFDDVFIATLILQQMVKMAPDSLKEKYDLGVK
ncbi:MULTISPECIES: YkvA family protein [Gracilibacillus]|uniref:YkvA family protein n=1 Tax=Gracilibacillus TaxID=74385 RepID=UPI00292A3FFE|nr:DUF1232 domain-containing protein [Gracilibacillus timonensis]